MFLLNTNEENFWREKKIVTLFNDLQSGKAMDVLTITLPGREALSRVHPKLSNRCFSRAQYSDFAHVTYALGCIIDPFPRFQGSKNTFSFHVRSKVPNPRYLMRLYDFNWFVIVHNAWFIFTLAPPNAGQWSTWCCVGLHMPPTHTT